MKSKHYLTISAIPVFALATNLPVFAEETSGSANAAVTTAMTTLAGDMVATGQAIVPIALTVVGIGLVVTFGIRIFRKIAKP